MTLENDAGPGPYAVEPVEARAPDGTRVSDYDYGLSEELIARYPAERRDGSRLLVLDRAAGDDPASPRHLGFADLPSLMNRGDLVVVNDSRVMPVRLVGRKPTGAAAEILLLRPAAATNGAHDSPDTHLWEALVRPGRRLKPGTTVWIEGNEGNALRVEIVDSTPESGRIVRLDTELPVVEALERYGSVPLPPYIRRECEPIDRERYQTVYAREPGSVAAPTAGLHFTPELLAELNRRGVEQASVTLHVGEGTFRPIKVERPTDHRLHAEMFSIPERTARIVNRTRERGNRVWAVGTTTVRSLESVAATDGRICPTRGSTDLCIVPPYRFRAVDALITNFHLPRSSLLMLVAAFAGYQPVMAAYHEAVSRGYRFYSYGDAMAIVP